MKFLLYLILFFGLNSVTAQVGNIESCTDVLNLINTVQWKKDSLGITGYRAKYFDGFKNCKPNKVTKQQLLEKLGQPSYIQKVAFGSPWRNYVQYTYYIINIDEKGRNPFMGLYLAFILDEKEVEVVLINHGDLCG